MLFFVGLKPSYNMSAAVLGVVRLARLVFSKLLMYNSLAIVEDPHGKGGHFYMLSAV
jgi:hypothetical protein